MLAEPQALSRCQGHVQACTMSITLHVSLLSGRTVQIETGLDADVGTFKGHAQRVLSVGKGRLVHPSGSVLHEAMTLGDSALCNGDILSLQLQPAMIRATRACSAAAFAVVVGDGSIVTWGSARWGGDSSAVQEQLKNVQQIEASRGAFAAILADGSAVTWGDVDSGGDSSEVQDQLRNVQQIQANEKAFAAILADGSVVTWGPAILGGDSSAVRDQLKNVQQIQAISKAFAAILADGSVATWHPAVGGGDSNAVQD